MAQSEFIEHVQIENLQVGAKARVGGGHILASGAQAPGITKKPEAPAAATSRASNSTLATPLCGRNRKLRGEIRPSIRHRMSPLLS